jgi:hypothetical protein
MSEPLCPMRKDGRHKRKPWHDEEASRSGVSCVICHRTWVFGGHADAELIPSWQFFGLEK